MNDFTKKELIALEDAMENMLVLHPTQNGRSPLKEKIESMIDNYCEHEIGVPDYTPRVICNDCRKHLK